MILSVQTRIETREVSGHRVSRETKTEETVCRI